MLYLIIWFTKISQKWAWCCQLSNTPGLCQKTSRKTTLICVSMMTQMIPNKADTFLELCPSTGCDLNSIQWRVIQSAFTAESCTVTFQSTHLFVFALRGSCPWETFRPTGKGPQFCEGQSNQLPHKLWPFILCTCQLCYSSAGMLFLNKVSVMTMPKYWANENVEVCVWPNVKLQLCQAKMLMLIAIALVLGFLQYIWAHSLFVQW